MLVSPQIDYEEKTTNKRLILSSFLVFTFGLFLGALIDHISFKETGQNLSFPGFYIPPRGDPSHWKTFDKNGIVIVQYGGELGQQYNSVTICQYALSNYNYYISTGRKQYKYEFLRHADWLVDYKVIKPEGFVVWPYNFDYKPYKCKAPWI